MRKLYKSYKTQVEIFGLFFAAAFTIVVLHLLYHPVRVLGMDTSIFYMDEKYTLAAFFSTVTAFLIGYLAITNIGKGKMNSKRIINLSYGLFFIGLALDEYFEIHEHANTLVKAAITQDGVTKTLANLSWIFPLSAIIVFVFILFIYKIKHSVSSVRLPLVLGVLCFFVVLIFELLGSASYGKDIYVKYVAIEEGMEMIGTSFFLLATLVETKKI